MSPPALRFPIAASVPFLLAAALAAPGPARAQPAPPAAASGGAAPALPKIEVRLRVPIFDPEFASAPVARIDGDAITLGELVAALEGAHGQHGADSRGGTRDFQPILQRLVDAKLLVAEARDSEVDKQPEVKEKIEALEEARLRDILRIRALKGIQADGAKVQRASDDAVTQYRMRSLNFGAEADARLVAARMARGTTFAAVAAELVAAKKATDLGEGVVPGAALDPVFGPVLRRTKAGAVTPPTRVDRVWVVAQLLEVIRKEDPAARAQAEEGVQQAARLEALHRYSDELARRHAKVDRKLVNSLDFDAPKPGAKALLADPRVIARVAGKKITVADLAAEMERHYFHGLEDASAKKKVNQAIQPSFDDLLFRNLLAREAVVQGLRGTDEFKKPVRTATDGLLFETFLKGVVVPAIQVGDDDVKKFYDAHQADYATPALVQLDGLAFSSTPAAEAALARLKAGTEFKWLRANADGVIPAESQKVPFGTVPVTAASLPEGLLKALAGAKRGDFRLYAEAGEAYVVQLVQEFPSGVQPLDQVRKGILDRLVVEKIPPAIKDYADKVRPHHEVKVYLARAGE